MNELLGVGSSNAKIILIGEHAVVYNKPAIALPFKGLETKVEIYQSNDEITISSNHYNGYLKNSSEKINSLYELIYKLLDDFKVDTFGLHFKITSNILADKGLGSSAAVAIALIKAFFAAFKLNLIDDILIEYAMFAERLHHTYPSGLDVYTLVYNKPIWYQKDKGFKAIDLKFDGAILVIDSKTMSKTKDTVNHVRNLYNKAQAKISLIFDQIEKLTYQAFEEIENNLLDELEETLSQAQKQLALLDLSNASIDAIIKKVNALGIKGAKITGAGQGGCIIAVTKDKELANKVKSSLVNEGYNVWVYKNES